MTEQRTFGERVITHLGDCAKQDTRVRAELRRSLAHDPGSYIPVFRYIECFVTDKENWRRRMAYLVAGLWAQYDKEDTSGAMVLPVAVATLANASESNSIERRFMHLLDADQDQLPHYLRQMTALLKDQSLNYASLLDELVYWNASDKNIQRRWAKEFYKIFQSTKTEKSEQGNDAGKSEE